MINRIRDVRKEKGMTLAEVAAACDPPTTAQTIGRLETGMRNLSLDWMNKIAAALAVEPEMLLKGNEAPQPQIVARLTNAGAEALKLINRDVLVPRSGGRFAFGRLIDRKGTLVGLLPPGAGQRQLVIDNPAWLAVAEMLVRKL